MTDSFAINSERAVRVSGLLFFVAIVCIAVLTTSWSGRAHSQNEPGYNVFLTNKTENNQPQDEPINDFDCSDRIFVVVYAAGLSQESHELKVRWMNPVDEQKELTRYRFEGLPVTKIWAWLQLDGGAAAIVGQMFDPSFGMEEFIGEWRAEVSIDGKKISEQKFRVLC